MNHPTTQAEVQELVEHVSSLLMDDAKLSEAATSYALEKARLADPNLSLPFDEDETTAAASELFYAAQAEFITSYVNLATSQFSVCTRPVERDQKQAA